MIFCVDSECKKLGENHKSCRKSGLLIARCGIGDFEMAWQVSLTFTLKIYDTIFAFIKTHLKMIDR